MKRKSKQRATTSEAMPPPKAENDEKAVLVQSTGEIKTLPAKDLPPQETQNYSKSSPAAVMVGVKLVKVGRVESLREQMIRKQKMLLDLQQQKLKLELMQAHAQLQEQHKQLEKKGDKVKPITEVKFQQLQEKVSEEQQKLQLQTKNHLAVTFPKQQEIHCATSAMKIDVTLPDNVTEEIINIAETDQEILSLQAAPVERPPAELTTSGIPDTNQNLNQGAEVAEIKSEPIETLVLGTVKTETEEPEGPVPSSSSTLCNKPSGAQVSSSSLQQSLKRKRPDAEVGERQPTPPPMTSSLNNRPDDLLGGEDECDLYGKLMAKKLRRLPEEYRELVMCKLDRYVIKIRETLPVRPLPPL